MRRNAIWLCVPLVVLWAVDNALTLWGQPADYWAGDYSRTCEANGLAAWALRQHPLAFVAFDVLWILFWCAAILALPRRLAMTVSLAVMFGHLGGATMWLALKAPYEGWVIMLFCIASAGLVVYCWDRYQRGARVAAEPGAAADVGGM